MRKISIVFALALLCAALPVMAEEDIKGQETAGSIPPRVSVGPDAFGYVGRDETEPDGPVFNFIDISGTGTAAGLSGDDAGTGPLPIGFTFNFYGVDYTEAAMSTNGYLNFNTGGDLTDFSNDCPGLNAITPNQSIYVYWDDMNMPVGSGAEAYYQTFSPCPVVEGGLGACTVFMWNDIEHLGIATPFDIEVILYDTGNFIMMLPAGNPETGNSATIGIENQTPPTIGLDYACNTVGAIPADRAIIWCYPGVGCPVPVELQSFSIE